MKKYCCLDINTGKFSDSWDEVTHKNFVDDETISKAKQSGWKLIEYTCLSDSDFEFYHKMQLR